MVVFSKLGKSITVSGNVRAGEVFSVHNLSGKIFPTIGIPVRESASVIGSRASRDLKDGHQITKDDIA